MTLRQLLLASILAAATARADEGMWTFDGFPFERTRERYGFAPDQAWLDRVRLSSARLAEDGCSASFVSSSGLVLTNHHCAQDCVEQLSTRGRNHLADGFSARTLAGERRCPAMEIDQLTELRDVTDRVTASTAGLSGPAYEAARKRTVAEIEAECAGGNDRVRCEVVPLYHGGKYALYAYRRFQDVRLVFAPELAIAAFGGDPDNFMFPRYAMDVAFVRAYDQGRPARTESFLRWSRAGVREGDVTFTSGNPGGTQRDFTVARLEYLRDTALPDRLLDVAELRGHLTEFGRHGPEQRRVSVGLLLTVENTYKAVRGELEALREGGFLASKEAEERELRARVKADPALERECGGAWDAIAGALSQQRQLRKRIGYVGLGYGFRSELFRAAQGLVRAAEERTRDNGARLEEYADARLPELKAHLLAAAPVHRELEILTLTFSLTKLREALGPDDPFVRRVLGRRSPEQLATSLVRGTRLGTDPSGLALRRRLWDGGKAAVEASSDPMIAFARLVDAEARAVRKQYEEGIESVVHKNQELIARARFAIQGTSSYPDATFTPRLSYGSVEGYQENGRRVEPFTTFRGAFARATGSEPFRLPPSWIRARPRLDLDTPFDFATSNDIVGGNSGSPVIDRNGDLVGLIFDGNIQSLGGQYGFDPTVNRAVAVDARAILEALEKIYGADRLVSEIHEATRQAAR
jgi:hypothetical protein